MPGQISKDNEAYEPAFFDGRVHLCAVVDSIPGYVTLIGKGYTQHFFSKNWLEFTGLERDELNIGVFIEQVHPEDRENFEKISLSGLKNKTGWKLIYRIKNSQNQYRWMLDMARPCTDIDGDFMGYIANAIDITESQENKIAIETLNANLEKHKKSANILHEMTSDLQVCRSLAETVPVLKQYMKRMFPEYSGSVYIINDSRSLVDRIMQWGEPHSEEAFAREECWGLRKGKDHFIEEVEDNVICEHLNDIKSPYVCCPMTAQGDAIGLLHIEFSHSQFKENLESEQERYTLVRTIQNVAHDLALNLSSIKIREALHYQSVRDPLTRLYNRRYMSESLDREISRSERRKLGLAVIMADVDHFKKFNDTHGHAVGDKVLSEIGKYLVNNLRNDDIACRYGGEELTIILVDMDKKEAIKRVENVRKGLCALELSNLGHEVGNVTVSMGLSFFPEDGETPELLLKAADSALYKAKKAGRNRLVIYDQSEQEPEE